MRLLIISLSLLLSSVSSSTVASTNKVQDWSLDQVANLLEGIFEGFYEIDFVKTDMECAAQQGSQLIANANNWVTHVKAWEFDDALEDLKSCVQNVQEISIHCLPKEHFERILEVNSQIYSSLTDDGVAWRIGMNAVKHVIPIVEDISDLIVAQKSGELNRAGNDLGKLLHVLIIGGVGQTQLTSVTFDTLADGFEGLFEGFYRVDFLQKDMQCVAADGKYIITHFKLWLNNIKSYEFDSALTELKIILAEVQDISENCLPPQHLSILISETTQAVSILRQAGQAETIGMNALKNVVPIAKDLYNAYMASQAQQVYTAAHNIGDILHRLIFNSALTEERQDKMELFLQ